MKKTVPVLALIVGLIAAGVAAYHFIETWPNIQAFGERAVGPNATAMDRDLDTMYRSAGWQQVYGMWAAGGLGALLGAIGAAKGKKKRKVFAVIGLVLSLAAAGLPFATLMASRI